MRPGLARPQDAGVGVDGLVDEPRLDGPACYHRGIGVVNRILDLERLVLRGLSGLLPHALKLSLQELVSQIREHDSYIPALECEQLSLVRSERLRGYSVA